MAGLGPELLNVVFRDIVRVSPQRCKEQARLLRYEGEGINLDEIEDVLSAGLRGEIVIDPGEQGVATKLPGVPLAFEADGLGQVQAMLASLAGQDVGTSEAVDGAANHSERIGGVAEGLLQIARELGAQVADQPPGKCAGQGDR